jgi:hypothetical protein
LAADFELRTMVQQLLDWWWSPEQICHELRRRFPGQPETAICARQGGARRPAGRASLEPARAAGRLVGRGLEDEFAVIGVEVHSSAAVCE